MQNSSAAMKNDQGADLASNFERTFHRRRCCAFYRVAYHLFTVRISTFGKQSGHRGCGAGRAAGSLQAPEPIPRRRAHVHLAERIVANCARMQLRKRPHHMHVSLDSPIAEKREYLLSDTLMDNRPNPEDECH